MDKILQLQVTIPVNNIKNPTVPEFGLSFHLEQIFIKFKDIIPDNLKNIFEYKIRDKISIKDYNTLSDESLMKLLNIYDITDKTHDKTVYTYRIGINWNDDFTDFEWIDYDKIMY